jgi:hypothetical protein
LTENEVQACLSTKVSDETVVSSRGSSEIGDLILRQNILIRCQGEVSACNGERHDLQAGKATGRNDNKTSGRINLVSTNVLVQSIVGASLEVNESGSSINDTRKAAVGNTCSSIGNVGDVDTPIVLHKIKL